MLARFDPIHTQWLSNIIVEDDTNTNLYPIHALLNDTFCFKVVIPVLYINHDRSSCDDDWYRNTTLLFHSICTVMVTQAQKSHHPLHPLNSLQPPPPLNYI